MHNKPFPYETNPSETDAAHSVSELDQIALNLLTDIAMAGNISSSRLFTTLPASKAWELQREAVRQWEETHRGSL